ncbi:hypothetical protein GW17_00003237 [Ensete ventricosum]|nr:hypothetical protein GW17_00003237 [Ensete ventricosum]
MTNRPPRPPRNLGCGQLGWRLTRVGCGPLATGPPPLTLFHRPLKRLPFRTGTSGHITTNAEERRRELPSDMSSRTIPYPPPAHPASTRDEAPDDGRDPREAPLGQAGASAGGRPGISPVDSCDDAVPDSCPPLIPANPRSEPDCLGLGDLRPGRCSHSPGLEFDSVSEPRRAEARAGVRFPFPIDLRPSLNLQRPRGTPGGPTDDPFHDLTHDPGIKRPEHNNVSIIRQPYVKVDMLRQRGGEEEEDVKSCGRVLGDDRGEEAEGGDKGIEDCQDAHECLTGKNGEVKEGNNDVLLGLGHKRVVVVDEAGDKEGHDVGIGEGAQISMSCFDG